MPLRISDRLNPFAGAGLCMALGACAQIPPAGELKPTILTRGVDSGERQRIDYFYSIEPDCSNSGYPEIRVLRNPGHGTVEVGNADAYPNFAKDNVRYECNRKKVPTSEVTYQSAAGFHGKDTLTIEVRYSGGNLRLVAYTVDVL